MNLPQLLTADPADLSPGDADPYVARIFAALPATLDFTFTDPVTGTPATVGLGLVDTPSYAFYWTTCGRGGLDERRLSQLRLGEDYAQVEGHDKKLINPITHTWLSPTHEPLRAALAHYSAARLLAFRLTRLPVSPTLSHLKGLNWTLCQLAATAPHLTVDQRRVAGALLGTWCGTPNELLDTVTALAA